MDKGNQKRSVNVLSYSSHSFIGRLTRDPEGRNVNAGGEEARVVNFTVAVDRPGVNKGADYYPVVVWRKLAENCERYLGKGRLVHVEGRPQQRSYKTQKDGVEVTVNVTEIIANDVQFLDRADAPAAQTPPPETDYALNISDDDLPF
jgi:single-strand DNA-binding protein